MAHVTNYLGPGSLGVIVKAVYLKSVKQLQYARYTALIVLVTFIGLFVTGLMGGILFFWMRKYMSLPFVFLGISLGLTCLGILPFFYHRGGVGISETKFRCHKIPEIAPQGRIQEILSLAVEGFKQMRSHWSYLFIIAGIYILQFLLSMLIFKLTFGAIYVPLSFLDALFLAVFTTAVNFLVITPNNLGIQELATGFFLKLLGLDFTQGVIGMGVIRAVHLIVAFVLTPLFIQIVFKNQGLTWKALRP